MRAREVELEEDVATLQAQLASTNAPPHQRVKHGSSSRAAAPPAEINLDPARAVAQLSAGLRAFSPILCAPAALLVPEQEDDWTCGHLNLATLLRCFRGRDWSVDVPGIVTLLHLAWAEGFDPHRPYGDREDGWIGALDMLSVLLHLRFDACLLQVVGDVASQGDDAAAQCGAGAAVHAAAAACLQSGLTRAPLVLQHDSHSRTILGVTVTPPTLVLRDPEDANGTVRCVRPEELDGHQYQLVLVRDGAPSGAQLDDEQALARRAPMPMASWRGRRAGWAYHDASWPLEFVEQRD